MSSERPSPPSETPLDSWKAIAAYLNRDARTVMRWEKSEGLPVHRHRHFTRSSVYAYPSELDVWRAGRRTLTAEPAPARRTRRLVAASLMLGVGMLTAGGGRVTGTPFLRQGAAVDRSIGWPGNAFMAPSAAMSPDGRYVTYVAPDPDGDLHVRDVVEGTDRRLTHIREAGGYVDYSAVSHDGQWVAVVGRNRDARDEPFKLYVVPLAANASTSPRVLLDGTYAAPREWSRDGRQILVLIEREVPKLEIGLVNAETGELRTLRQLERPYPGYHIRMSPDGRFVAYDHPATPNVRQRDVLLIPVNGGADLRLLDGPSSDTVVGWSPDGGYLIVESDRSGSNGLWAVPVSDGRRSGEPVLLKDDFRGDPLSLTDGGDLFYEAPAPGFEQPKRALLVASVDFEKGTLLKTPWFAAHDRNTETRSPRWTAGGSVFTYLTQRPAGPVLSIRTAGGTVREVPRDLGYVWTFDWSPDGTRVVYRATDLQGRRGIFVVDATTGDVTTVALSEQGRVQYFNPQFVDDGAAITYITVARIDGAPTASLIKRQLATGTESVLRARLEVAAGYRLGPTMARSPDGRFLLNARSTSDPAPRSIIAAHDTTTKQVRDVFKVDVLDAFNPEDGLQWLPDSSAFVVNAAGAKENERVLWWVPMDGRTPHILDVGRTDLVNSAIAIHPDGQQIAFVAGDPIVTKGVVVHTEFRLLQRFLPVSARR
jgi:Tol biopolymer transport system component